jgi:hypothetical protein
MEPVDSGTAVAEQTVTKLAFITSPPAAISPDRFFGFP